jgi:hypothetical protein
MSPDDPFKRPFPDENYVPPKEEDLRKQALQKAYEIAASITTEQAKEKRATAPIDWGPRLRLANAALAVAVALWLFFAPPDWLPQTAKDERSREQRELGLRIVLAAEASRVNAYRDTQGRLPASLAEAGGDARSVRYVVTGEGQFTLSASDGAASLSYESSQPLGALLSATGGKP